MPWLAPRGPYLALLPVGLAVPVLLPVPRCALTAPFQPYQAYRKRCARRFLLCGAVPGVAPAGRYPAPFLHGVRTFLDILFCKAKSRCVRQAGFPAERHPSRLLAKQDASTIQPSAHLRLYETRPSRSTGKRAARSAARPASTASSGPCAHGRNRRRKA